MKDKFKGTFNTVLNVVLLIAIIGVTYSWMITLPTVGEIVNYNRQLVVTSSSISVKVYAYIGGQYVEQTTSPMNMGLLAPGTLQRYRFDITNNNGTVASTKIVLSDITGDTTALGDFLIFGSTSPTIFTFLLKDRIKTNAGDNTKYIDFVDKVDIPANSTLRLYWYANILNSATNEIGDKGISIDKIAFIKP